MSAATASFVIPPIPALRLARRYEYRNRLSALRELGAGTRLLFSVATAAVTIAAVVVRYRLCEHAAWWLDPLRVHLPVVALAAALIARGRVMRSRQRATHRFATSWLSVAPIERRDVEALVRERVLAGMALVLGTVIGLVCLAGMVSGIRADGVIVALLAGAIPGALVGWWSGRRPPRVARAVHVRIGFARRTRDDTIGLAALGRWPFAERFASLRPQLDARIFGTALLSMPMGIPPLVAIAMLLLLTIAMAATTLLKAQIAIIPRAADWLRTTPLALKDLVVSSSTRAVAWQCTYALAMALLLDVLGAGARMALAFAVVWIAWIIVSILSAFARRYRPRRLRLELSVLAALLAALAAVALPLAAVAVVAAAFVQWKRAVAST